MNQQTAILLFSRTAAAEAKQGLAAFGIDRGLLAARLIRKAERLARESGLPLFRSDERSQQFGDFGTKLSAAIAQVFAAGYERVLVMGNDCPQLRRSDLRKCKEKLEQGATVLGPDLRGGTYLLGLQKAQFDEERFADLSWQKTALLTELQELFPGAEQLRKLQDVNTGQDLLSLVVFLRADRQLALIAQLLSAVIRPLFQFVFHKADIYRSLSAQRGPPALGL